MKKTAALEKNLLQKSVFLAVLFAFSGIVIGLLAHSQILLFDGLYSLISVGLSTLSLSVSKNMGKTDWKRYPFGKTNMEPLVIMVQYIVIMLLVTGSVIGAIVAILQGGRTVQLDIALIYASISTLICFSFSFYLKKEKKNVRSGLLSTEAKIWTIDGFVSLSIFIAFVVSLIFQQFPQLMPITPYIDPILVVLVSLYFIKAPLWEIRHSIKEVLDRAPEGTLLRTLEDMVKTTEQKYEMKEHFLRVSKGRKMLWIEVDFVVHPNGPIQTIQQQDAIREELAARFKTLGYEQWLTISFTQDRKWAL